VDILKYFQGAIEFLDKVNKEGKTCMIHCYAGINRSGTIALIYYIYKTNKNVFEAYEDLTKKRPGIISNIGFRNTMTHLGRGGKNIEAENGEEIQSDITIK
jgi:protein-tyrosine phosphatase